MILETAIGWTIGKILDFGVSNVSKKLQTSPAQKALNKILKSSLEAFCGSLQENLNDDEKTLLRSILEQFLKDQKAIAFFAQAIFRNLEPLDKDKLEKVFNESGFDSETLQVNFNVAISEFHFALKEALEPHFKNVDGSPLRDFLSLQILRDVNELQFHILDRTEDLHKKYDEKAKDDAINFAQIKQNLETLQKSVSKLSPSVDPLAELLSESLSKEWSDKLEIIVENYRNGKVADAFKILRKLKSSSAWDATSKEIRGKIIRTEALWVLNESGDINTAKKLIENSEEINPDGDFTNVKAFLTYFEKGADEAIDLLQFPKSISQFNLLVNLTLTHKSPSEALSLFKKYETQFTLDPESERLRSLGLVYSGQTEKALETINKACLKKPNWQILKLAKAIINFWNCFPQTMIPNQMQPYPIPFNIGPVKYHKDVRGFINEAQSGFIEILKENEFADEQLISIELWLLASQFIDPEKFEEASKKLKHILIKHPTKISHLTWALAICPEEISPKMINEALRLFEEIEEKNVPDINDFLPILLVKGHIAEAEDLLCKSEKVFKASGNESAWFLRKIHLLLEKEEFDEVIKLIDGCKSSDLKIRCVISTLARIPRSEKQKAEIFLEKFGKEIEESKNLNLIFQFCEVIARFGEWETIAKHHQVILKAFPTQEALRLFAIALWNIGKHSEASEIIETKIAFLNEGTLPSDLAQILTISYLEQGKINEAQSYVNKLCEGFANTSNLILKLKVLIQKGSRNEIAVLAKELLGRNDLSITDKLDLVRITKLEEPNLARQIVRQFIPEIVESKDSNLAAIIISLAYSLGLDNELKALFDVFPEIVAQPQSAIKLASLKEFAKYAESWKKQSDHANKLFRQGSVSIHMLSEAVNLPLSEVIRNNALRNRLDKSPIQNPGLYTFSGGRNLPDETLKAFSFDEIYADLSSIYVAHDIEILDLVLKEFESVKVPQSIIPALINEREKISHNQPSEILIKQTIIKFVEQEKLLEFNSKEVLTDLSKGFSKAVGNGWLKDFSFAEKNDGYLVDYLPLQRNDLSEKEIKRIPARVTERLLSCRGLLEILKSSGKISQEIYEKVLEENNQIKTEPFGNLPELQDPIFFAENTISFFVRNNLINVLSENFKVFVSSKYLVHCKTEITFSKERTELLIWLQDLQDLLSSELGKENPTVSYFWSDSSQDEFFKDSPALIPFGQLMASKPPETSLVWCDDRWVNSHAHLNNAPFVTSLDLIRALYLQGKIEEKKYFQVLQTLRASNYRFIPLTLEELLFHIGNATVDERGVLVENEDLVIIRRYYNACLSLTNTIRLPAPNGNLGEITFVQGLVRVVNTALAEVWKKGIDAKERSEAEANWIFYSLYSGTLGIKKNILEKQDGYDKEAIDLLGIDTGSLLTKIFFILKNDPATDPSKLYLDWLEQKWLIPQMKANPELAEQAAQTIKFVFSSEFLSKEIPPENLSDMKIMLRRFLLALPDELSGKLFDDPKLCEFAGIKLSAAVHFSNLAFFPRKFWSACSKTLKGKHPVIQTLDKKARYRFSVDEKAKPLLQLKLKMIGGQEICYFNHPVLEILNSKKSLRKTVLEACKVNLDLTSTDFKKLKERVVKENDDGKLGEEISLLFDASCQIFYSNLEKNLLANKSLAFTDFIPENLEELLHHFRIQIPKISSPNPLSILGNSINAISSELPLEVALNRWASFPITFDEKMVGKIDKLTPQKRKMLFERLRRRWNSPLHKIHLLGLLARYVHDDDETEKAFNEEFSFVFSEEFGKDYDVFVALLNFTQQFIFSTSQSQQWLWDIKFLIVAAHAARLQNILYSFPKPPREKILELCERAIANSDIPMLFRDRPSQYSLILNPLNFKKSDFTLQLLPAFVGALKNKKFPAAFKQEIENQAFPKFKEKQGLNPDLFFDPTLATNTLKSPLGEARTKTLGSIISKDLKGNLSIKELKKYIGKICDDLLKDPTSDANWGMLIAYTRFCSFPNSLKVKVEKFVDELDFEKLLATNSQSIHGIISLVSRQLMYTSLGNPFPEMFWMKLRKVLKTITKKEFEIEEAQKELIIVSILETAYFLSLREKTEVERTRAFVKRVSPLSREFQDFQRAVFSISGSVLKSFPAKEAAELWPLLVYGRASH